MNQEDIKYRQGRSKRQHDSNEMIGMYAFTGLVIFLVILTLFGLISSF